MELGIEDEEKNLYKKANNLSENFLDELEKVDESEIKPSTFNKGYSNRNSKYVIQMNVYCNKLDENKLDEIFNYINRRFGAEY